MSEKTMSLSVSKRHSITSSYYLLTIHYMEHLTRHSQSEGHTVHPLRWCCLGCGGSTSVGRLTSSGTRCQESQSSRSELDHLKGMNAPNHNYQEDRSSSCSSWCRWRVLLHGCWNLVKSREKYHTFHVGTTLKEYIAQRMI